VQILKHTQTTTKQTRNRRVFKHVANEWSTRCCNTCHVNVQRNASQCSADGLADGTELHNMQAHAHTLQIDRTPSKLKRQTNQTWPQHISQGGRSWAHSRPSPNHRALPQPNPRPHPTAHPGPGTSPGARDPRPVPSRGVRTFRFPSQRGGCPHCSNRASSCSLMTRGRSTTALPQFANVTDSPGWGVTTPLPPGPATRNPPLTALSPATAGHCSPLPHSRPAFQKMSFENRVAILTLSDSPPAGRAPSPALSYSQVLAVLQTKPPSLGPDQTSEQTQTCKRTLDGSRPCPQLLTERLQCYWLRVGIVGRIDSQKLSSPGMSVSDSACM
jgi:hypothetical protein